MNTLKPLEPLELEALCAEAERKFSEENEYRAEALSGLLKGTDKASLFLYFTDVKDPLLVVGTRYPELSTLVRLVSGDRSVVPHYEDRIEKAEWHRETNIVVDLLGYHQYPLDADVELGQKIGYDHLIFLKEAVAQLRATALLYRHFMDEEPGEMVKHRFVYVFAMMYNSHDLTIPPSLRLLLTKKDVEEMAREKSEARVRADKVISLLRETDATRMQKEIEEGVDYRFAKRRAEVENKRDEQTMGEVNDQDQVETKNELNNLLSVYPDPRVLIDYLLELRGGKLPV